LGGRAKDALLVIEANQGRNLVRGHGRERGCGRAGGRGGGSRTGLPGGSTGGARRSAEGKGEPVSQTGGRCKRRRDGGAQAACGPRPLTLRCEPSSVTMWKGVPGRTAATFTSSAPKSMPITDAEAPAPWR